MPPRGESLESVAAIAPEVDVETNPFDGLSDEGRKNAALRYGLPESASWQEISTVAHERNRKRAVESLGLPDTATMDDVRTQGPEIVRQQRAREFGLNDDATWDEIMAAKAQKSNHRSDDLEAAA
ncbi:MAG: hypothetical protein HY976_03685 [Candidatus Kerfeldbacteria bacterium]|nr:hypothetical protein [Candidatus Kerfeldbacteria bacterium]